MFFFTRITFTSSIAFHFDKIIFIGLDDKGDNNCARFVFMNKPPRVQSVLLMEDLSEWKNKVLSMLTKDEVVMCLKNIILDPIDHLA